jgi:elongation factor P
VIERTFKSGDSLEAADVFDLDLQYLYTDGEHYHFMNTETYEQYAVPAATVGDSAQWLKEEALCVTTLWNNEPINVNAPNFVVPSPGCSAQAARGSRCVPLPPACGEPRGAP